MKNRYHYKTAKGLIDRLTKLPERCKKCEYCLVIDCFNSVSCRKRKGFTSDCADFIDREEYRKRNEYKPIAKPKWRRDLKWNGHYARNPYCPSCGEYAQTNEEGRCVFCGQLLDFSDDPREKNVIVEFEHPKFWHVKATQVGEYHHVWVEYDSGHIHANYNGKMMAEEELIEYAKRFLELLGSID